MAKVNFRVCIDDKENPIPYVERTELQKKLWDNYYHFFKRLVDNEIEVDRFWVWTSDVDKYNELLESWIE